MMLLDQYYFNMLMDTVWLEQEIDALLVACVLENEEDE